jgi:acylphosphatase
MNYKLLTMNITTKHIVVKGKVQGVFFRKHTQQKAEELNITGWVRNTNNGDVEILAQGAEDAVAQFIQWCKDGSPKAEVSKVEVDHAWSNPNLKDFSIAD